MKKRVSLLYGLGKYITAVICSVIIAVVVGAFLYHSEIYLYGSEFCSQLYKLDVMEKNIDKGRFFPLYANEWYNGYEVFRYTSPACYFFITMIFSLIGGNIYKGICVFYGIMAFVSQMGFLMFGIRHRKMIASCLTGIAFLLLPSTFSVVILEGNFDIAMGFALMPLILFFLYDFIKEKHRLAILPFSVVFMLLILSNYVLAIAFGIVVFMFLIFSIIITKSWKFEISMMGNILLIYMVMGSFIYPALSGGILSRDYSIRGSQGVVVSIAVIAVAVLGLVTANKSRASGFLITIIFAVLSLPVMENVMKLVPSKILQRPYWYMFPIIIILLITLLTWERLRFIFLVLILGIMVGENVPTILSTYETLRDDSEIAFREERMVTDYLLEEAVSCTDNRVALIDISELGDFPQWYFAKNGISTMFGWDYENSPTVQNQISLNEAFMDGFYDYVFDRLLLYGNDTVVVLKEILEDDTANTLKAAAKRNGYEVRNENEKALLFKADDVHGTYGVISQYDNLAIGSHGAYICYIYPSFELGRSNCLEDYTIDELKQYSRLYLSGFTYRDKEKAENMLRELSQKGVSIYIEMQNLPVNALSGKNEFMNVYAQFVQFTEDFPILSNENGNQFKLDFKVREYARWNTVYISGCEKILRETQYDNKSHLVYLGQNGDENITFMGFNLVYYYLSTHNRDLKRFLDETFQLSSNNLSKPIIVPVHIENNLSEIVVDTKEDNVNCSIAVLENLEANRIVSSQENLYIVNQGETVFRIVQAKQKEGIFISILGIIATGLLWIMVYVLLENENNKSYADSK